MRGILVNATETHRENPLESAIFPLESTKNAPMSSAKCVLSLTPTWSSLALPKVNTYLASPISIVKGRT